MNERSLIDRIAEALGSAPVRLSHLAGGCLASVHKVTLEDGRTIVAKAAGPEQDLTVEAWMLEFLNKDSTIPVPAVFSVSSDLLLMEYVTAGDPLNAAAEEHLADLVAGLHNVHSDTYGLSRDTVIGPLAQGNAPDRDWVRFFRDRRLLAMADEALHAGRLPLGLRHRIDRLAERLDRLIAAPNPPGLIHGDLWGGNVLVRDGRVAALIDPAIYYADPEIELAFATLFGTVGETFFARYREHRALEDGFFGERRPLYLLYPLLVHVRLFGGGYVGDVARTLDRFGV